MSRAQVPIASPLRSMTLILKHSQLTTVLASWASSDPMLRAKSVWPAFTTMTSRFRDLTASKAPSSASAASNLALWLAPANSRSSRRETILMTKMMTTTSEQQSLRPFSHTCLNITFLLKFKKNKNTE